MKTNDATEVTLTLCAQVLRDLGTDVSRECLRRLEQSDFRGLIEMEVDPSTYTDAFTFSKDYLAVSLLSKYPNMDTKIDRRNAAIVKFFKAEHQCLEAYWNMRKLRRGCNTIPRDMAAIFHTARRLTERALGPFSWDEVEPLMGFGPGAAVGIPHKKRDRWYKFGCLNPTVTPACSALVGLAIARIPRWLSHLQIASGKDLDRTFRYVKGNTVTTVPKNAKTERIIAKEPLLNAFVQRGIGRVIRRRLKRVGIDLDNQKTNQELARVGSLTDSLATIDLSSASDTLSLALVEELLPEDWVAAIKLCRSPLGVLPDGTEVLYRKVSSMGNGYTFELESLVFWALSKATLLVCGGSESTLSVYGDDIIVPSPQARAVIETLAFAGFSVNVDKTFIDGPFRESCGKHYFRGVDVTPFYVREDIASMDRLFWFCNRVRFWAFQASGTGWGCDGTLLPSYQMGISRLPERYRRPTAPLLRNGDVISDCALGGDFDEVLPQALSSFRRSAGWDGFSAKIFVPRFKVERDVSECDSEVRSYPLLLKILWAMEGGAELGGAGDPARILGRRVGWKLVRLPVPQWEDVGCWLPPLGGPSRK